MNSDSFNTVIALLILLVALLQFLLHAGPQTRQVQKLDQRLEEAEARLNAIWAHMQLPPAE